MAEYDAFLLVSFGGPEGPGDVMPFLENVTRGRGIPPARLAAVAEHYYAVGGVSPINQQCRDLLAAIGKDFAAAGIDLPVYWGNRNWAPYLTDTVAELAAAGVRRALAFVTSGYGSYSSCRQYLDDIERARAEAGPGAPEIHKLRHFFNHPGFIEPFADATVRAVQSLPPAARDQVPLVFTAHSVPTAMAAASGPPPGRRYPAQLAEAARLIADRVILATGGHPWRLVYQSRSGPPSQPWLGPDVCDHLAELAAAGAPAAVLVPVGFITDHMEVVHDLDIEAAERARELGLPLARAATPGTDPRFVSMITGLVSERLDGSVPPAALGALGPAATSARTAAAARPAGRARGGITGGVMSGWEQADPDPAELLALARSAAEAAARMLASRRPAGPAGRPEVADTKSSPTDVVTEMDRAAEALITERIRAVRPGDAFLAEEGGESGRGRVRWIVDPLDGTVNYLYGLADWAVSIAAEVDGQVLAGVVAIPRHGELFTAIAGQGSWLHQAEGPACRCAATPGCRCAVPWCPPGSATRGPAASCRVRWSRSCCPRSGTSAAAARARSICARWRRAGWTPTTSVA